MKITITIDNNPVYIESSSIESLSKLIYSINLPIKISFDESIIGTQKDGDFFSIEYVKNMFGLNNPPA